MVQQIILPKALQRAALEMAPSETQEKFIQDVVDRTGYRLCTPSHLDGPQARFFSAAEQKQMRNTMRWIHHFIMRSHPRLGRAGVVCPYVKLSLDADIFYLSVAQMKNSDRYDDIFSIMHTHADIFAEMEPRSGPLENLRVLMVLVPNGRDSVLSHPDQCKRLKTEMMQRGVTVGQFFPTWNPVKYLKSKFFPNQPPLCMYTMRTFIPSDWMFINGEPEWREVYLEKFGKPPDPRKGFTVE